MGFLPFQIMGKLGDHLSPIRGSFRRNNTARWFGLLGRPSLQYQLGLSDDLGLPDSLTAVAALGGTRTNTVALTDQMELNTSVKLFGGFNLKSRYTWEQGSRSGSSSADMLYDASQTFPGFGIQWSSMNRLPILKYLINSANFDLNYERKYTKRGQGGLEDENLLSKSDATTYSPSWSARWKGNIRTNLRTRFTTSLQEDWREGTMRGKSGREERDITFSINYSFSAAKGIPLLFWKLKLKSNLDVTLDVNTRGNRQKQSIGEEELRLKLDERERSIRLNSNYRFSRKFTGGANMNIGSRQNKITDSTRRWIEVGFRGTITF